MRKLVYLVVVLWYFGGISRLTCLNLDVCFCFCFFLKITSVGILVTFAWTVAWLGSRWGQDKIQKNFQVISSGPASYFLRNFSERSSAEEEGLVWTIFDYFKCQSDKMSKNGQKVKRLLMSRSLSVQLRKTQVMACALR